MYRVIKTLAKFFLALLFLNVLFQVINRELGIVILWTEEIARFSFIWFSLLGAALAVKDNSHYIVDFLVEKICKGNKRNYIDLLINFSILLISILIFWQGIRYTIGGQGRWSSSAAMQMTWVYLSLPISSLCMSLFAIEKLGEILKKILKR